MPHRNLYTYVESFESKPFKFVFRTFGVHTDVGKEPEYGKNGVTSKNVHIKLDNDE